MAQAPLNRSRTLTLLGASALTVMSGSTIAPALPALREHFAGEPGIDLLVRLVLSMPALIIALTAPLVGLLADRLSKQRVLCTATDRKSTRLNSSHVKISYAVFCLTKKSVGS